MREILCFCFGKHGKKTEKSRKTAQSLPGDDCTDTSAADVLYHLYFCCCWRGKYFNAPQVYVAFGVKADLSPFGRRPAKAGAIMIE